MSKRRFPSRRLLGGRSAEDYQIAIAYDGERTEDEYFRGWQLLLGQNRLSLTPYFVKSGGSPLVAVKQSLKCKGKNSSCAEFWCVTDVDDTSHEDVIEAENLANKNDIRLCLSRRCFEIWMALHYGKSSKPILCEKDAIDLVSSYLPNYTDRAKSAHFSEIWFRTDVALSNADWLVAQACDNPATNVQSIVRKLGDNLPANTRARLIKA